MKFSILAAIVSAAVAAQAVPTNVTHTADVLSVGPVAIGARSLEARQQDGCGSIGPLGEGHYIWYITVSCTSGDQYYCQAMDASGCYPGTVSHIGSMEVDDPDDTVQYAKQSNTNSVEFTCPSAGTVRCEANFNDNDDGPNYSLRVVSA